MNFLIYRDFLRIFINFFIFSEFNMATDVAKCAYMSSRGNERTIHVMHAIDSVCAHV